MNDTDRKELLPTSDDTDLGILDLWGAFSKIIQISPPFVFYKLDFSLIISKNLIPIRRISYLGF